MEQLLNAFPAILKKDVVVVINALPLDSGIKSSSGEFYHVTSFIHTDGMPLLFNGEWLKIPVRVYFNEPSAAIEAGLTTMQQTILHCIYLRHHNGFVRQRRLEMLLNNAENFIVPFSIHLLGEYVIEILDVLDKHINHQNFEHYSTYINENPRYWQQTQSRMVSYWNAYYRQKHPKLSTYIGKKIVNRLNRQTHNA